MKQSTTRWFIPIPAIFLAFYSLSAKADNNGVCLPPVIATLPPETVAPPPETIAIPIATMPLMLIPPTTGEPVRLVGPLPLVPPSVETTMPPPPETVPPPITTIVNETSTTSIYVPPTTTTTTIFVPPATTTTTTSVPTSSELVQNKSAVLAVINVIMQPEVLSKMDIDEIDTVFQAVDVELVTEEQATLIIEALYDAPPEVIAVFERNINVFDGAFDEYVPEGSAIPIRVRRSISAVGVLIASAGTSMRRFK